MNARAVFRAQCKYNPLQLPTRRIARFPVTLSRLLPPHSRSIRSQVVQILPGRPIDPALRTAVDGKPQFSERTPDLYTSFNNADSIDRLLQGDGLAKWGFVIYRCTYQNDSNWEDFMTRLYDSVKEQLNYYNGLDLLDSFAPTVIEDPAFTGATTAVLREHFKQWAPDAFQRENPDLPLDSLPALGSGRYRFFIMVDQESLESVLNEPKPKYNNRGYVRLVQANWEPLWDDENLESEEQPEPLEGYTLEYVGWMKVVYDRVQISGFLALNHDIDWIDYYERPPAIQDYL